MVEKRVRIIIFILLIVMLIVGIVGCVLYFATDLLKSESVLFKKYLMQDVKNVYDVIDVSVEKNIIDQFGEQDYQVDANTQIKYLEKQNDQEELYVLKNQGITNNSKKESFRSIDLSYGKDNIISLELLNKDEIYGLRVASLVEQFVSIKNSSISFLVSSLGYDGQYFSEKMNSDQVTVSKIMEFSDKEIQTLASRYSDLIFYDIDKSLYSSKHNAMITLGSGESITVNNYNLTLTKNDIDKIYKRVLNQAINDEIILGKIEQLDDKIKELGFNEPEGQSLKEKYIAKLKEKHDSIEYQGTDNRKYVFSIYTNKGKTVRVSLKNDQIEYIIDTFEQDGKKVLLKINKMTPEGTDTEQYLLGKKISKEEANMVRTFSYTDSNQKFEAIVDMKESNEEMNFRINTLYSGENVSKIETDSSIKYTYGNKNIQPFFNNKNNIVLNDYDGERIKKILDNLKNRVINDLEKKESKINTKLLNNILIWIDNREKEIIEKEKNNEELKKERFNNKFKLYQGTDLDYTHVNKLLEVVSRNMSDFKVISGKQIRIYIQEGRENQEKVNQISKAINDKHRYNVTMKVSNSGYIEAIDIEIAER